jgi:hypothetical protein
MKTTKNKSKKQLKPIWLDPKDHAKIKAIADANVRAINATAKILIDEAYKKLESAA